MNAMIYTVQIMNNNEKSQDYLNILNLKIFFTSGNDFIKLAIKFLNKAVFNFFQYLLLKQFFD